MFAKGCVRDVAYIQKRTVVQKLTRNEIDS